MNRTQEKEALLWGLVGITLFAATLPMTRLAVGSTDAPQLSPWFVTFGRAAVAGLLSIGEDDVHESARRLVDLANEAGGRDNVSVIVIEVLARNG